MSFGANRPLPFDVHCPSPVPPFIVPDKTDKILLAHTIASFPTDANAGVVTFTLIESVVKPQPVL